MSLSLPRFLQVLVLSFLAVSHSLVGCVAFAASSGNVSRPPPIPITVISGFLGSGKTTLLRHILENNDGLKIAVIVNDVASVNIDEKLVVGGTTANEVNDRGKPDAVVQLSNGCACCSLSDELLSSVSELITLSDMRDPTDRFDHIVIETSGVSDPRAIRGHFQDAMFYNMPLMERVRLDTMVTVVDCTTFLEYLKSGKGATEEDSPELFYRTEEERLEAERLKEKDWYEGLPDKLVEALQAGDSSYVPPEPSNAGPGGMSGSGVSDLLVEQTEVADVLLLNKVDILREDGSEGRIGEIENIATALNPRATVMKTEYAVVDDLDDVLAVAKGRGVAEAGVVDDHRDFVDAAEKGMVAVDSVRKEPDCKDPEHTHEHSYSHDSSVACTDPDCKDPTTTHDYLHSNGDAACNDPNCTDPTHKHDHSHSHSHSHNDGSSSYSGIGTYVFRARRPFHPQRLTAFLRHLPIVRGVPAGPDGEGKLGVSNRSADVLRCIVRSKGFAWLADSNLAAMYWSHAGSSFEMQCLGRWWATLPRNQWPEEAKDTILAEFDNPNHEEEEASLKTVGDRRQEIVFIGPGLSDPISQGCVHDTLNKCLLSDDEWEMYTEHCSKESSLRAAFANPLPTRMVSY